MAVVTYRSTSEITITAKNKFEDNTKLTFGDEDDAFIQWNGSALEIKTAAGGVAIQNVDLDLAGLSVYHQIVYKTTNQSLDSTILGDDDELVIPIVMSAGDFVLGRIGFFGKVISTDDIKIAVKKGASPAGIGEISAILPNPSNVLTKLDDSIVAAPVGFAFGTGSEHEVVVIDFWYSASGGGTHTLTVQWAKNTDVGAALVVEAPSYIAVTTPRGA